MRMAAELQKRSRYAADEDVRCKTGVMASAWRPDLLLDTVRAGVPWVSLAGDERVPVEVLLDGEDLLVTFLWRDELHRLGVRFRTSKSPEGPSTGEMCETPEEWAQEVALVLMEELDTGLVHRAPRSVTEQGVVELHYRPKR